MPEEIMTNLYRIQISLPNSPLRMLNSYVIKGEVRNILIDTGFNLIECRESLMSELHELGVDMADTDILLTHLHADHTGLVPEIYVPGSRVFISRQEIPWLYGQTRRDLWARENQRMLHSGFTPDTVGSGKTFSTSPWSGFRPGFRQISSD